MAFAFFRAIVGNNAKVPGAAPTVNLGLVRASGEFFGQRRSFCVILKRVSIFQAVSNRRRNLKLSFKPDIVISRVEFSGASKFQNHFVACLQ